MGTALALTVVGLVVETRLPPLRELLRPPALGVLVAGEVTSDVTGVGGVPSIDCLAAPDLSGLFLLLWVTPTATPTAIPTTTNAATIMITRPLVVR